MAAQIGMSQQELNKVERFLRRFGEASGVYISAYEASGRPIGDFNCSEEEKKAIQEYVTPEIINDLFQRVAFNSLEDQVVENTAHESVKVAAAAIKLDGHCRMIYFFCGVLDENTDNINEISVLKRRTEFYKFLETIDLLREITADKMLAEMSVVHSQEQSRKSQYSANEMAESLRRVSAMTEVLKYLDSDRAIENIMGDFLSITADYLNVDLAYIVRNREDNPRGMDVMNQWCKDGMTPIYDKTVNQNKFFFLEGSKPIILSSGSAFLTNDDEEWKLTPIRAVVAMPVTIGSRTDMYVVYIECEEERTWRIDELQFLSDSTRILQSILEKRIQKNSLASSYASLEEILENVGCAIVVHDYNNKAVLFENRIMKNTFGKGKINSEMEEFIWDKNDIRDVVDFYDYDTGLYYEIHHNNISWVDGRPVGLYAIYDVTDKKSYQKRIEQQAYTDFLTGLFNRMCCERDLARVIDESRKSGISGALLYLDLDDFKHINDGLGHQYGDVLLKEISCGMKRVPGIEETCYRMGGDEFVIIVPPRSYGQFDRIISDIKAVFSRPYYLKDGEYYCTMSMGIVKFPDEGESVSDLVQKADVAMYEAKKSGKNRVATYNSSSMSDANKRLDMEKNMRVATTSGYDEFIVYYQPIIDIQREGTPCVGAEALVRWNSGELGFVSPADFIPLAEYLGLINPIGDHIMREACKTCVYWNTHGHPEFKINVNLSVVQLMQNDIVEKVEKNIEETGINPRNLTLEVTESLAINDMERMKGIMNRIRAMGVRIALDDFGTGYSSLNHIREIPLDVIKVDQCFVKNLVDDDYSKSFIKMVTELAGAIGVSICVEGVETMEQYKVLQNMKTRLIQGYYFDRPMTKENFIRKYIETGD